MKPLQGVGPALPRYGTACPTSFLRRCETLHLKPQLVVDTVHHAWDDQAVNNQ